jgi:hypothetical protein
MRIDEEVQAVGASLLESFQTHSAAHRVSGPVLPVSSLADDDAAFWPAADADGSGDPATPPAASQTQAWFSRTRDVLRLSRAALKLALVSGPIGQKPADHPDVADFHAREDAYIFEQNPYADAVFQLFEKEEGMSVQRDMVRQCYRMLGQVRLPGVRHALVHLGGYTE